MFRLSSQCTIVAGNGPLTTINEEVVCSWPENCGTSGSIKECLRVAWVLNATTLIIIWMMLNNLKISWDFLIWMMLDNLKISWDFRFV